MAPNTSITSDQSIALPEIVVTAQPPSAPSGVSSGNNPQHIIQPIQGGGNLRRSAHLGAVRFLLQRVYGCLEVCVRREPAHAPMERRLCLCAGSAQTILTQRWSTFPTQ